MKNKGKMILLVVTALCCAAFAVYRICCAVAVDHAAPEIMIPAGELQVSVDAGEEALVQGVTASDDRDGDVTASLVVESVSAIFDGNKATATLAAFDSAGNVAKAKRTLCYTDYQGPRFTLSAPLLFREGRSYDVFALVGATDPIDGDLSSQVKGTLVSGQASMTERGVYEVEFRVTNSLGDTAYLTAPVEVCSAEAYDNQATLSSYLVYLKTGGEFRPRDYLVSMRAGSAAVDLSSGIPEDVSLSVQSDVDTSVPGVYSVTYTLERGNYTGMTRLLVVVEE